MTESSRSHEREVRDIARDARRERFLIPQALLSLLLVAVIVVLREVLVR